MSTGSKIFIGVVVAIPLSIAWLLWDIGILFKDCDTTDYSPIIKKVAVPMQQELGNFYTKNHRFPTTQERDEMLERVGCKMEGNVCVYESVRIAIQRGYRDINNYNIAYNIKYSYCYAYVKTKENKNSIHCDNEPCIHWEH